MVFNQISVLSDSQMKKAENLQFFLFSIGCQIEPERTRFAKKCFEKIGEYSLLDGFLLFEY